MALRRIVGIDLGTTHTVMACSSGGAPPAIVKVAQLVAPGQVEERALLPSSLFLPAAAEPSDAAWQLAVTGAAGSWVCGEHARRRGAEVAARHVGSAKSWLSYAGVDRRAAILPWRLAGDPAAGEADEDAARISPIEASALVLAQVARAFELAFPGDKLADQEIVLTVPASFDAVARELTVMAATASGLTVRLLEEPQAAFYDFMRRGGPDALAALTEDGEARVLVCDVGGGTTDLSLMAVRRTPAGPSVERLAVGRHLLLGGDNMDLALAHRAEARLVKEGERLDVARFAQLTAACRTAKERLLGPKPPAELQVAVAGRGAALVGGTLRTGLTASEAHEVVVEGFFPDVALDEPLAATARAGIVAFGLPYEREVAITRHVAAFLRRHAEHGAPTALLLNGGVFRAPAIVERMRGVVSRWRDGEVTLCAHTDPDESVALGAVAYGLALAGRGLRIGGGAAQSYFLGVGDKEAVCVLARGAEEGQRARVARTFELTVGAPVRFELYATDAAAEVGALDAVGEAHEHLAPLVTTLVDHRATGVSRLPVAVEAELSAIGTLELSCVEIGEDARRFALAFDLRAAGDRSGHEASTARARYGKRLEEATAAIEHVYGKRTRKDVGEREVKGLVRELERILGKRGRWDASLSRALYDALFGHHRARKATVEHERAFWMLAGFCLRPGAGHPEDPERVKALFALFEERLAHAGSERGWQQYWIAWRRVAAGLDERAQTRLRDVLDPFLAPESDNKGMKKAKPFKNEARWEMLELAAGLERVAAARRGELGGWILERTWTERDPRLWAALGRLGARTPVHGSAHHVVAARTIERWMDHLLRERWENIPPAPRAAVAMCRITGDRARDVADKTRAEVDKRLTTLGIDAELIRPIRELVALDDSDRAAFYGEDLPLGLRVVA
jgi:molecular chaperone DnaK (HSP70)